MATVLYVIPVPLQIPDEISKHKSISYGCTVRVRCRVATTYSSTSEVVAGSSHVFSTSLVPNTQSTVLPVAYSFPLLYGVLSSGL